MIKDTIEERTRKGIKVGIVGFLCNIVLFGMKFTIGTITGSFSIIADAVNNLSDSLSSVLTIIGFKLSAKPADKEHPFGHERFETLSGFIISGIMLYLGIDIFRSAIEDIIYPSALETSVAMYSVIILSVLIKGLMALFYKKQATKLDSEILLANMQDSLNDVMITSSIGIALVIQDHFGLRVDAWFALGLAVFIMVSALKMIRDFIDDLLGARPDPKILSEISSILKSSERILGFHDLMIYNYGKFHIYGIVHVELDANQDLIEAHDVIDSLEREIRGKTGVNCVIHMDPLDTENPEILAIQKEIKKFLKESFPGCTFHDLRFIHDKLYFEVVLGDGYTEQSQEIKDAIRSFLRDYGIEKELEITIEKDQLI